MEKKEDVVAVLFIFPVQCFDPVNRQAGQFLILLLVLHVGVHEVGEQSKVQVIAFVGEEADLQSFHQGFDICFAGQECGDDHQGAGLRGDAFRKVHAGQEP